MNYCLGPSVTRRKIGNNRSPCSYNLSILVFGITNHTFLIPTLVMIWELLAMRSLIKLLCPREKGFVRSSSGETLSTAKTGFTNETEGRPRVCSTGGKAV